MWLDRLRLILPILWVAASATAAAGTRTYLLDPLHTRIEFDVDHLGFARAGGRFARFDGRLEIDAAALAASRVVVEVAVASLQMGDDGWNRRMLGRTFFAAVRFPQMRFRSTRIELDRSGKTGTLHGELELLGQRRPLALAFTVNRHAVDPYTLRDTWGFSATGTLDRRDFGMDKLVPEVGATVQLRIEVQAYRKPPRRTQAPGKSR